MAPSKIRRALNRVKDQTSIGLAIVGNLGGAAATALEVAIVRATRHEEKLPSDKHLKEIAKLTSHSHRHVGVCVAILARRLKKTRNWVVALKTLIIIHRLLSQGGPSYDHEVFFFTTRSGEHLLDMSGFQDSSGGSNALDFTVFVRMYARYLEEQLEFRVEGNLRLRGRRSVTGFPAREMKTGRILRRGRQLLELLDRFLACRPTGMAKLNRVVLATLESLVMESFDLYFHLTEIMTILIDRFMVLEVPDCMKVLEMFCRAAKQFNEMDCFYAWCRSVGIARMSDYPLLENITPKKLMIMDEYIREKAALARAQQAKKLEAVEEPMANAKALPAAHKNTAQEGATRKGEEESKGNCNTQPEFDLLDLREDAERGEDVGDRLALTLFEDNLSTPPPTWVSFGGDSESSDWETLLMESVDNLSIEKPSVGGSFDMSFLDSLYQQGAMAGGALPASAVEPMLPAFPAPSYPDRCVREGDAFETSPVAYAQMGEVEGQQKMAEQQPMWQQYVNNGMHGPLVPTLSHGW